MHPLLRPLATIAALAFFAGPAMAGGLAFDTPTLTWPQPDKTVTKSCRATEGQSGHPDITCPPSR